MRAIMTGSEDFFLWQSGLCLPGLADRLILYKLRTTQPKHLLEKRLSPHGPTKLDVS